ncbi:MAG: UbiA family prenyltransferase [Candidatus Moraniibacteriota bacterium]
MKNILTRAIHSIEKNEISYGLFLCAFISLIFLRLLIENTVGGFPTRPFLYFFFEFSHTFLFFLFSFLLFLPLLSHFAKSSIKSAANILLFGFLIILTPPLLDWYISGGTGYWSFYEFDGIRGLIARFFSFFGSTPEIGVTYGVRIEVALSVLLFAVYIFLKTRDASRALLGGIASYAVFFILGTFPSYITIAVLGFSKGFLSVTETDVAGLFLSPNNIFFRSLIDPVSALNFKMSLVYGLLLILTIGLFLLYSNKKIFLALYHNVRFPQVFYHGGLALLGIASAFFFIHLPFRPSFFEVLALLSLIASVISAWIASVIVNDLSDQNIDAMTNPTRPLPTNTIDPKNYTAIGISFFIASLILAGIISFKVLMLLLCYQAIAWVYSAPPFRLKRFPGIATLCAACASILILLSGFFLVAPDQLEALPRPLLFFLLIAYTFVLPIKDFKDIEGDRADGVFTLPVLLGAERAKLLIGGIIFLLFIGSVFILNAPKLILPAFIFGTLTFWLIQKSSHDHLFFSFRSLPAWMISLIILYGFLSLFLLL